MRVSARSPSGLATRRFAVAMKITSPLNSRKIMATALRALVIEDSENDCMLLLSILRRGGYACARTTSVLTTAVVFVWSLMRCLTIRCDRRTPTQNARKNPKRTPQTHKSRPSSFCQIGFRKRELRPRNPCRKERNRVFVHFKS